MVSHFIAIFEGKIIECLLLFSSLHFYLPCVGKTKSLCSRDKAQVVGTQKISPPDALFKGSFG